MPKIENIIQAPLFLRKKKRLNKNEIKALDAAIRKIIEAPEIGVLKAGDLSGVRVYKYSSIGRQTLLAYEISDTTLFLYTFGSHENFYRALKKYINR
jgi:mRNA interferase RelE/StbE